MINNLTIFYTRRLQQSNCIVYVYKDGLVRIRKFYITVLTAQ